MCHEMPVREFGGSGDCGPASSPYPCLIFRNTALPLERAPSSNGKRPDSTCGPSCPRLSSIARHAHHDPPASTASLKGLPGPNVGAVKAAMFRPSPVPGLRPVRAGRLPAPKVPNPAQARVRIQDRLAVDGQQRNGRVVPRRISAKVWPTSVNATPRRVTSSIFALRP